MRGRTLVCLIVAVMAMLAAASPAFAVQSKNVAVSRVTSSSAVLVVKADVTADVTVEYGTAPGSYSLVRGSAGAVRHEVLLDGFPPSSTVYYRVTIADSAIPASSIVLPEQSFHLARQPGAPFSFAVAGDNRPSSNTTVQPAVWGSIVGQMAAEGLDLSLNVGDIIWGVGTDTSAQNEARYDGLFASTNPFTASVPMYVAVGNHEMINSAVNLAGYLREFTFPVNNGADAAAYGELYYSFDNGDTHFVALSTEIPGQMGFITGNQRLWLQQDLAANTQPWVVVYMHMPLFTGTHTLDPWTNMANVAGQQNKAELHSLFRLHGVDVVFEGHDHYYLRHVEDGIQYVVTGGGGAPLYNLPVFGAGDVFGSRSFEYVKVDETATSLRLSAIASTGTVLETLTLGAPALSLSRDQVYWASFADYLANDLSVDYTLANTGAGDATGLEVVWLSATNGVVPLTATPLPQGTIAPGGSLPVTFHYQVPAGIMVFRAATFVTCGDNSGGAYAYPGPAPVL